MTARQSAALRALQDVLDAAFRADPTLVGLVTGRIHDGLPRAPVLPCLAFAEARARDWSGGDSTGTRAELIVEVIADDDGRQRAMQTLDRACELATGALPPLAHGTLTLLRVTETDVDRFRDGRTWRARAAIEALIDG